MMKKLILKSAIVISIVALAFGLLNCKGLDSTSDSSKISVDISGLLASLPVDSSSSSSAQSSDVSGQIASPPANNDAQSAVTTLLVVPLTYSKHGKPYSTDNFDDAAEDDFEDDAVNSANYLQYIQLPTSKDFVEIEVPPISEGWQLVAAATKEKVASTDDLEDSVVYYIGFTEQAFESADAFNKANVTLELKRNCDQDEESERPKGCATFDGDKDAIVTNAVEIHRIDINGVSQPSQSGNYPWVVRDGGVAPNMTATEAANRMNAVKDAFVGTITNITVYATHSLSDAKSNECKALDGGDATNDFEDNCGKFQTYSRDYP